MFVGIGAGLFKIVFFSIFFLVLIMFVAVLMRVVARWSKNNASPELTVDAVITSKRMEVSHQRQSGTEPGMDFSSTSYYVTFEVESGDRMELPLAGSEAGLLCEGDQGRLTFQGTRFIRFERMKSGWKKEP